MKISDEIALSARNLARRKGRTALTLIGVVIGTCMVVLMISLGIAQTQANDEMLQSWGDLTQIQVYGGGMAMGPDGQTLKLDDAAIDLAMDDELIDCLAYIMAGPDTDDVHFVRKLIDLDFHRAAPPAIAEVGISTERVLIPWMPLWVLILLLHGEVPLGPALLHLLSAALDQASDDHRRA